MLYCLVTIHKEGHYACFPSDYRPPPRPNRLMARGGEGRLAYADLLRSVSMLAVVVLHVTAGWFTAVPIGSADWHVLNVFDSLVHWCVPVFVMLSGMFLLDPKKSLSLFDLLFRYLLRMGVALLFWGYFYEVFHHVCAGGVVNFDTLRILLGQFLRGGMEEHLWYVPMTMGLYLVTPILRAFVRGAKQSDFHWFFLVTVVFAVVLPTFLILRPSGMVSFWIGQMRIHLVFGFVGFYVAGYYLKTYTLSRLAEAIIYVLGIAGAALTVWGTWVLTAAAGYYDGTFHEYLSPGVVAMSVAVFVLFRYVLGVSEERSRRQRLGGTARVSFGVYLVHIAFLTLARSLISRLGLPSPPFSPVLAVPVVALLVFLPSFFVAWLVNKIPVVGRYLT